MQEREQAEREQAEREEAEREGVVSGSLIHSLGLNVFSFSLSMIDNIDNTVKLQCYLKQIL